MTCRRSPCTFSSRVIGRSSQSGPLQGVVTLGTIGQMALTVSDHKCQHYSDSVQPSRLSSSHEEGRLGHRQSQGRCTGSIYFETIRNFSSTNRALEPASSLAPLDAQDPRRFWPGDQPPKPCCKAREI